MSGYPHSYPTPGDSNHLPGDSNHLPGASYPLSGESYPPAGPDYQPQPHTPASVQLTQATSIPETYQGRAIRPSPIAAMGVSGAAQDPAKPSKKVAIKTWKIIPENCICQFCSRDIVTQVERLPSSGAYIVCCILSFVGFCLLPFMMDDFYVITHFCPNCGRELGHVEAIC